MLLAENYCWTYSHHCQIADKNPSKRWNGGFWGVRICIGWICTTGFCVVGFVCSFNFSVSFPATTPRATTPHRSLFSGYHAEGYHAPPIPYGYHAEGYHARTYTFKLTGYHVCRVTTPELPRSIQTSGYRRVITPASLSLIHI